MQAVKIFITRSHRITMINTEIVVIIINYLILGLIISMPIWLLVILKRYRIQRIMLIYNIISIVLLFLLIRVFAWWGDRSNHMLLGHFWYNIDGMSDTERLQYVAQEHIDTVRYIERRTGGVGWPLHALIGFVTTIPYLIIVAIGYRLIDFIQRRRRRSDRV